MAQVSMTVRMDSQLKKQFNELCNEIGMSVNTAINIFANALRFDKQNALHHTLDVNLIGKIRQ